MDSLQLADDDSLFADTVASDALQPPYSYPSYTMGPMEITLVSGKCKINQPEFQTLKNIFETVQNNSCCQLAHRNPLLKTWKGK